MSDKTTPTTDLVREIRLRQWARRNFVPMDARQPTWHPVVLDEMRRRDEELTYEAAILVTDLPPAIETTVEAVVPTEVPVEETEPLSAGEAYVPRGYDSNFGSRIVPLTPDGMWTMHPAAHEIPAPHFRNMIQGRSTSFETPDIALYYELSEK